MRGRGWPCLDLAGDDDIPWRGTAGEGVRAETHLYLGIQTETTDTRHMAERQLGCALDAPRRSLVIQVRL